MKTCLETIDWRIFTHLLPKQLANLPSLSVGFSLQNSCCRDESHVSRKQKDFFGEAGVSVLMLDINLFRAEKGGNPELVKESQRRRGAPVEAVDEVIALDKEWVKRTK